MTICSIWRRFRVVWPVCLCMMPGMFPAIVMAESYEGVVSPGSVLELRAGVSGRVQFDNLVAGAMFVEGEVLVTIERDLYVARLESARARLDLRQSELQEAERAFERSEILYDEGSLSQVEFDHSSVALKRVQADFRKARADMTAARVEAELSELTAPFDGVVLSVSMGPGEFVNAATDSPLIARIALRNSFIVPVVIPPSDRRGVENGLGGSVVIGTGTHAGTVGAVHLDMDNDVPEWRVEFHFTSDRADVQAGMPARVELP